MAAFSSDKNNALLIPSVKLKKTVQMDAKGSDSIWKNSLAIPPLVLAKGFTGKPTMLSKVRAVMLKNWLILNIEAEENAEIIARESVPGKAMWFDDAFRILLEGDKKLEIIINPLGNFDITVDGKDSLSLLHNSLIKKAARIDKGRWSAELAIDLQTIITKKTSPISLKFRITRQRQPRGYNIPYEESSFPASDFPPVSLIIKNVDLSDNNIGNIAFNVALPQDFEKRKELQAGICKSIPSGEKEWAGMPACQLQNEDGRASLDPQFQYTVVRSAISDSEIAFRIECSEGFPDSISDSGKEIWREDNIEIFIGPERSALIQLMLSPSGKAEAALVKPGGRHVKSISLPDGLKYKVKKTAKGWVVYISLPLKTILSLFGLSPDFLPMTYPWAVQISRNRPSRKTLEQTQQYSMLSVTRSATSHCPLRYAQLKIIKISGKAIPEPVLKQVTLPSPVLNFVERKKLKPATALKRWVSEITNNYHNDYEKKFTSITAKSEWEDFSENILSKVKKSLFPANAGNLPTPPPLNAHIVYDISSDGFRCQGVIYQSRPGLYVPATLYLPEKIDKQQKMPAMVIIPAHHTQRNSRDIIITGSNFARAGGIAMVIESIGSGERTVTALFSHKREQRNLIGTQLLLSGETLEGWNAVDIIRGVDYLLQRGDVDSGRLGILGGVAGGGDLSALAAALDTRIMLSIPFNFVIDEPFVGYYDPLRAYYGVNSAPATPWMIDAMMAPRLQIQAEEFEWTPECRKLQDRFKKVYRFYDAEKNITYLNGGFETHATHFNWMHRIPMYKIINRWFGMKLPETKETEYTKLLNRSKLDCFHSSEGVNFITKLRKSKDALQPHEIAKINMEKRLEASRKKYGRNLTKLICDLDSILGHTEAIAVKSDSIIQKDCGTWAGALVKGIWLPAENRGTMQNNPGLGIAMWVIRPELRISQMPAVLCIAQSGKARFLNERTDQIKMLLDAGITVALADVRGTGETSPGPSRLPEGESATIASELWMLSDSMPAGRLKDVRTALAYLATLPGIDKERLGLWGEGFSIPNGVSPEQLFFEETGFSQASPTPKTMVEPTGGLLALLAGLYPFEGTKIKAVLARGTVASFSSALNQRHHYLPMDAIIPKLLSVADTADLANMLDSNGQQVILEDLRDAQNRIIEKKDLSALWKRSIADDYKTEPTKKNIIKLINSLKGKNTKP